MFHLRIFTLSVSIFPHPYGITQPEAVSRDGEKETLALVSYDSVVGYSSLIW